VTLNESRTLDSGDRVEWINIGTSCAVAIGVVGFNQKRLSHYVGWPDGQRTWLCESPAFKYMRVVSRSNLVNGFPR
jgi:hypothetical protein